ncbi:MAG TPA: MBOAT family O-acyltransferase [Candidatus Magasanikbacteria bacterium]|nr:MBOAT family O-acyltransferase [Candidatus Magasanikbacteria bacterium]
MVFSSISFLVFFLPLTLLVYYLLPSLKAKNIFLFLFSLLFYAWGEMRYVFVMLCSIVITYGTGYLLGSFQKENFRKFVLITGIFINLLFLYYFKYYDFSLEILNKLFGLSGEEVFTLKNIVLPVGISFYTFQSISYLIDVYRTKELAQKNFIKLGLYISCFPQLIAGPIVRYHEINEQLSVRKHELNEFAIGVERFIIGLAKKVIIANTVGEIVDLVFATPFSNVNVFHTWVAVLAYSLQIYYDFSGYSDMAIGLGKMFGFSFPENFNYPYISKSITEFWRRWHMSLSRWFKDYLYIPLGGNRKGTTRTAINLLIVFICTGIWHGAAFNFLVWGLIHGFFLFLEKILKKIDLKKNLLVEIFSRFYTLLIIVLSFVIFRTDLNYGFKTILKLFGIGATGDIPVKTDEPFLILMIDAKFWLCFLLGILFAVPWWKNEKIKNSMLFIFSEKYFIKYALLLFLYFLSFVFLTNSAYNPFIYFRF